MIISDGTTEKEIRISKDEITVNRQTTGEWVHLGKLSLRAGKKAGVSISGKNATGVIAADGMLLVSAK